MNFRLHQIASILGIFASGLGFGVALCREMESFLLIGAVICFWLGLHNLHKILKDSK